MNRNTRSFLPVLLSTWALFLWGTAVEAQCCGRAGMRMPPLPQMPGSPQLALPLPQNPQQYLVFQQQYLLQQQYLQMLQNQSRPTVMLQDLVRRFSKENETDVQKALANDNVTMRLAAAIVVGLRGLDFERDLIGLLEDPSDLVRQASRRSLVSLSAKQIRRAGPSGRPARSVDFGPSPGAGASGQRKAAQKWQEWWDKLAVERSPSG